MKIDSLFDCKTYKFKPKHSLNYIQQFRKNKKYKSSFQMMKRSTEELSFLQPENYVLQFMINRSVETFVFSIFKDKDSYFLTDKQSILRFHKKENALKYKIGKIYNKNYMSNERLDYFCYQFDRINKDDTLMDFINNAYSFGKRVYVQ